MPPSAEYCRVKAFECAELAEKTMDPFSKLLLVQTAGQWCVLAEGAEKYKLTASEVTPNGQGDEFSIRLVAFDPPESQPSRPGC